MTALPTPSSWLHTDAFFDLCRDLVDRLGRQLTDAELSAVEKFAQTLDRPPHISTVLVAFGVIAEHTT